MSCVFDYYYGEESESCSFYRIPRLLIVGERFSGLSTDAKLLYGLMLDRMNLSARNGWYDDAGRVYIYYTLEEIQESMSCGHGKAVRLLAELDTGKGIGLIERTKQGQGRPTRIYVKRYTTREMPAPPTKCRLLGAQPLRPHVYASRLNLRRIFYGRRCRRERETGTSACG